EAELRKGRSVERGNYQPRRVELERLGGDACDQLWLQEDMQFVVDPAGAHEARAAGRQKRDRSGRGRRVTPHAFVSQIQLVRRADEEEEPVMSEGRHFELEGGGRAAARCLKAGPPQSIT